MTTIWVGIHERLESTRILVTAGPQEVLLKARLRSGPGHPRALPTLLEALALWQGATVHAVLSADAAAASSTKGLMRSCFLDFGEPPLYSLAFAAARVRHRRRDDLTGLGEFRDLQRLLGEEVAR
jgi:hypothetical protein